jgi:enoyl-CoA hydratase/carnithine racemase
VLRVTDTPSLPSGAPGTPASPEDFDHLYPGYDTLVVARRGRVGWLIFNRPKQLNAMNSRMRDELAKAWLELDADPAVRVIVHTGEGRAFQTGVDVTEIATDGLGMERYREEAEVFDLHFTAWHQRVEKPVIAAVNGLCGGGGFHFVADADIVICASDSKFFDPHVSVGQVVSFELMALLRKMPFEPVMRMALVGAHERMPASRAYELGLVSEVVEDPAKLRERAAEIAEMVARNSPVAMRATKRALWGALEDGLTDACRKGAAHLVSVWGHPDQLEGPAAFVEKRDARWAELEQEPKPASTIAAARRADERAAAAASGDGASA